MEIINELRRAPFVRMVIPFITGILIQLNLEISFSASLFFFTGFSLLFLLLFLGTNVFENFQYRWVSGLLIYIILICSGMSLCALKNRKPPASLPEETKWYSGTLLKDPEITKKTIRLLIRTFSLDSSSAASNEPCKAIIFLQKNKAAERLGYGKMILFRTKLTEPESPMNPFQFNYKKFLSRKGIYYSAFVDSLSWLTTDYKGGNFLKSFSTHIREKLLNIYRSYNLTESNFAIISALTLGYEDALDRETESAFASAGVIHLLAVSGLHVGIIYLLISHILGFLDKSKFFAIIKTFLVILSLLFYALLTGLAPSVTRAVFMFSLIQTGLQLKRDINIYNIIAASAFILLLINPLLITDVGFQLSYLAVLSILYFQPKIYGMLFIKNYLLDKVWALMAVSLAAQAGTFPLTLHYFGQFPVYFWLGNLFVLPLATISIYIAVLLLIISPLGIIATGIALLLNHLLTLTTYIIKLIGNLPGAVIDGISFEKYEVLLLFMALFFTAVYIMTKKYHGIIISLCCILLLLCARCYQKMNCLQQHGMTIYNLPGKTVCDFFNGNNNTCFTNTDFSGNSQMGYITKGNRIRSGVYKNTSCIDLTRTFHKPEHTNNVCYISILNNTLVNYLGNTILLAGDKNLVHYKFSRQLKINYLLVTNNFIIPEGKINNLMLPEKIIADASNSDHIIKFWKKYCMKNKIPFYDVKHFGALSIVLN